MIALPRPTPHFAVVGGELIDEYEKLAKKLKFSPAELLQKQLLRFLNQSNIDVFDYGEVESYMTALANNLEKVWVWRPLREQDIRDFRWNGRSPNFNQYYTRYGHGSYCDEWKYRQYQHIVPMHILQNVDKIDEEFRDQVQFFVSDYGGHNSSHSIMVTALDVGKIIFGIWD